MFESELYGISLSQSCNNTKAPTFPEALGHLVIIQVYTLMMIANMDYKKCIGLL